MSRQKLKVTFVDGTELEVKITPKAEVEVERHFDKGMQSIGKDTHAEHLYYLAYQSLVAAKKEHRPFEEFLDVLEDVDPVEQPEDDGVDDPSKKAQLPAPS